MLDSKDCEIIQALDFKARDSNAELGRRLNLGPSEIDRRLKRMVQEGVIRGFQPIIDVPRLGYYCCRLLVSLYRYSREDKAEIIDYLVNHPLVFLLVNIQGEYDLYIDVWASSISKIKQFNNDFEERFGQFIKHNHEAVITDVTHFAQRFLTKKGAHREIKIGESDSKYQLSKDEEQVLKLLSLNARYSEAEIAENSSLSAEKAAQAITKLEDNHIIKGYRPMINLNQIGYVWYKLWLNVNKLPENSYRDLLSYIHEHPNTYWLIRGVGLLGDVEVEVVVQNPTELYDFIDQLRLKFPAMIDEYDSFQFAEVLKTVYLPIY